MINQAEPSVGYSFVFHQAIFKKVASTGLESIRKEGYQILVKIWGFDDPFHKKRQVLVILVPWMIQPSGPVFFLIKRGCWGHWDHWGCWGWWGHRDCRGAIVSGLFKVSLQASFGKILFAWWAFYWGPLGPCCPVPVRPDRWFIRFSCYSFYRQD